MNTSVLPPQTASATRRPNPPVVDLGTRVLHAAIALGFATVYLTSEWDDLHAVHEYGGYTVAALLALRLLWGLVGPASAKLSMLLRRLGMLRVWWGKLRQGQWTQAAFWQGVSGWALSAAIVGIYAFVPLAAASGWATDHELLGDGWLGHALEELHDGLGNGVMAAVALHLGLLALLRVWRGPQGIRPMWRGR